MAFSVANLKDKASKAKNASVSTFTNTRDRLQSTPTAKTNWDYNNPPPRPPPQTIARVRDSDSYGPPPPRRPSTLGDAQPEASEPPPVIRNTRPNHPVVPSKPVPRPSVPPRRSAAPRVEEEETIDKIDWANLTLEDKQVFFSWLDQFFARYLNLPIPPRSINGPAKPAVPIRAEAPKTLRVLPPSPAASAARPDGPPRIPSWSKPKMTTDLVMSYPPPSTHGCAALDLAHYIHPSTHWDSAWYINESTPPPLQSSQHAMSRGYRRMSGNTSTFNYGVVFADLSICWFTIEYPTNGFADPNDERQVKRSAKYLPRPPALDGPTLVNASETYGETIASFAEGFAERGEYCARGECWDLANEALKYFDEFDYVDRPVPSISRTHGHLIFEGRATGNGKTMGRWRGGDDRIRRGDIAEWRKVKIAMHNAPRGTIGGHWTIGDPDHTSVIVRNAMPAREPADGQPLSPEELGIMEVVDQSVSTGLLPKWKELDMRGFMEGEMWIYRPVSMSVYLGTSIEGLADCPLDVHALNL